VVTVSGLTFCQRTVDSVELSPSWIPGTGTTNYATVTSTDGMPLQISLVQYLIVNTDLLSKYPQLTSCYAGIIARVIPVPPILLFRELEAYRMVNVHVE
jgi:hypothetical protein